MDINPFAELSLAVFTTCMPLAAGAFFAFALAAFSKSSDEASLKRLDKFAWLPVGVLVVGFAAAMMHLASPFNAFYALSGVGRSPLSTEVVVAGVFLLVALIFAILATLGRISGGARKVFLGILACFAILLAVATGLAYHIDTIPPWASPWPVVAQVGYTLIGCIVGAVCLSICNVDNGEGISKRVFAVVIVGVLVAVIANAASLFETAGMVGATLVGADLVAIAMPYSIIALLCGVAVAVLSWLAIAKQKRLSWYAGAAIVATIGIFLARLAFYCLQMGIGL